jgi:hypothetical protein
MSALIDRDADNIGVTNQYLTRLLAVVLRVREERAEVRMSLI